MLAELEALVTKPDFVGKVLGQGERTYKVKVGDNYSYTDPIDKSVASKQVHTSLVRTCQASMMYLNMN